jgi:hypothetical protein
MFEGDLTTLSTADLLESAAEHRAEANRAEARLLEHAQIFADRYHPTTCPPRPGRHAYAGHGREGRERGIVLGGDGCPEIAEFAPAEFGVMLGVSTGAAAAYIGQALALRHRFPHIWAKVQAGAATPWRACKIATACLDLSEDAAAAVDKRLARIVDTVTPHRLENIVKAAKAHADPEAARAEAEQKARERGVYVGRSDEHGTKTIYVRAASGDVIRFDATIASIAEALKVLGDTTNLRSRRAKAIGIIADPRYTEELLLQARNTSCAPEPAVDDEADRDAPHPGQTDQPDPLDAPPSEPVETVWPDPYVDPEAGETLTPAAQRALDARLAQIKYDAHTHPRANPHHAYCQHGHASPHDGHASPHDGYTSSRRGNASPHDAYASSHQGHHQLADASPHLGHCDSRATHGDGHANHGDSRARHGDTHACGDTRPDRGAGASRARLRPGKTEVYVHLTDHTLATGNGVLRVEGVGPLLASQLAELIGHGPYVVKPVIDLNDAVSVDAYEIPDRIRERVKLTHPVELFPYGTRETHRTMDLDHIQPYDPLGPPGQTNTTNLAPLRRFTHRVKTHGDWNVRRLDAKTLQWTTPNGFTFHVTPTGTTRVHPSPPDHPT